MDESEGQMACLPHEKDPQENNRYAGNARLIEEAQAGDEAAMERLIVLNMGLVRSLAVRFKDRGTEMEDLIQIGTIGMIKAIRSFDLSRGTTFSTYAVPLIVGEIRRHLRDDGMIKVSRTYRRIGVALMNAQNRIRSEEGRDPTIGELAELCGVSPEEAAISLDAIAPVSSLSDTVYGEEGVTLEGTIADEGNYLFVRSLYLSGTGIAQGNGDRIGGMTGDGGIILAFPRIGKSADAIQLSQCTHGLISAREHLVYIGLMSHVKYQFIPGEIQQSVQGDGDLHYPKIAGEMSAVSTGYFQ